MKRPKSGPTPETPRGKGLARLKRRALLVGALAIVSAIGVAVFDASQSGRTFLLVRNLTDGPLSDIEVSGPQGGASVGRLLVGEARGSELTRSVDGNYRFHVRYKEGPETDVRIFGGKLPFEGIELQIGPTGVTSMARAEDQGFAGRTVHALAGLRQRLGL